MYTTILLAAALQNWERYSAHALAARNIAMTLAKGAAQQLHVLSVYDYPPLETTDLLPELAVRYREDLLRRTDTLMVDKLGGLRGAPPGRRGGGQPDLACGQSAGSHRGGGDQPESGSGDPGQS